MIYTVTFNPSLDYIVTVDDFKLHYTNRTTSELMLPGGKGIKAGICGELAADLSLTKEFLLMGYDELSVNPGRILSLRKKVRETRLEE